MKVDARIPLFKNSVCRFTTGASRFMSPVLAINATKRQFLALYIALVVLGLFIWICPTFSQEPNVALYWYHLQPPKGFTSESSQLLLLCTARPFQSPIGYPVLLYRKNDQTYVPVPFKAANSPSPLETLKMNKALARFQSTFTGLPDFSDEFPNPQEPVQALKSIQLALNAFPIDGIWGPSTWTGLVRYLERQPPNQTAIALPLTDKLRVQVINLNPIVNRIGDGKFSDSQQVAATLGAYDANEMNTWASHLITAYNTYQANPEPPEQKNNSAQQQKITALQAEIDDKQQIIKKKDAQIANLQRQISDLMKEKDTGIQEEIDALKGEIARLKGEINDEKKRTDDKQGTINKLQEEVKKLKSQLKNAPESVGNPQQVKLDRTHFLAILLVTILSSLFVAGIFIWFWRSRFTPWASAFSNQIQNVAEIHTRTERIPDIHVVQNGMKAQIQAQTKAIQRIEDYLKGNE